MWLQGWCHARVTQSLPTKLNPDPRVWKVGQTWQEAEFRERWADSSPNTQAWQQVVLPDSHMHSGDLSSLPAYFKNYFYSVLRISILFFFCPHLLGGFICNFIQNLSLMHFSSLEWLLLMSKTWARLPGTRIPRFVPQWLLFFLLRLHVFTGEMVLLFSVPVLDLVKPGHQCTDFPVFCTFGFQ